MSSLAATFSDPTDVTEAADETYRAMSSSAVAGLGLGVLSVLMLGAAANGLAACLVIAPVPILGIILSSRALSQIRRLPEDYTGSGLAQGGLMLSTVFLVGGLGWGGYRYATEVPEGYERISFLAMKPSEIDQRGGRVIPSEIEKLAGEKVFIKGYMRPPSQRTNLSSFLLVRDDQQCCFGPLADVKYFDQMQVELVPPLKAEYSTGVYRIGGRLKIHPENATPGSSRPVFTLVADHLN
jgi:hypothetical protein